MVPSSERKKAMKIYNYYELIKMMQEGTLYGNERIVRISKKENTFVTNSYNPTSQRIECHFYYLDTNKHRCTKSL